MHISLELFLSLSLSSFCVFSGKEIALNSVQIDSSAGSTKTYRRHQNDYMQLLLFPGINLLKITITFTCLMPVRTDSREM